MKRVLLAAAAALSVIALVAGTTPGNGNAGQSGNGPHRAKTHEVKAVAPKKELQESRRLPSPDQVRNLAPESRRSAPDKGAKGHGGKAHPDQGALALTAGNVVVGMRALVIAADGTEPTLAGIKSSLDQVGVPYDVMKAVETPLTQDFLVNSQGEGKYEAVLLATANLVYDTGAGWLSAFDPAEWDLLAQYQLTYGAREIDYYTYPTAEFGLSEPIAADTTASPIIAHLTEAGHTAFPYLVDEVPVAMAWTYLAQPIDASTVPLVAGPNGSALVSLHTFTDGREAMVLTMDGQAFLMHSNMLGYGIIDWATRNVFIGERAVYYTPQIDDVFFPDAIWDPATLTTIEEPGYRITSSDWKAYIAWQDRVNASPLYKSLMTQMVFNGEGASLKTDPFTKTAVAYGSKFRWVNHTWDHTQMDLMTYTEAKAEISKNNTLAGNLKLPGYTKASLVTPEISGLFNSEVVRALVGLGVKYTVGDTSRPNLNNPKFNVGLPNPMDARLYIIPRYPTNIFYNVSTPAELVSEYNFLHRAYWGRDLSYAEIMDAESNMLVTYLLTHSINPLMYHAGNLRAYDGVHSLVSDVTDATLAKYSRYYNLPIRSPAETEIGQRMQDRGAWQAAGVTARLVNGTSIVLTSPVATKVPVTGVAYSTAVERYGTETISWVRLSANTPITLPVG